MHPDACLPPIPFASFFFVYPSGKCLDRDKWAIGKSAFSSPPLVHFIGSFLKYFDLDSFQPICLSRFLHCSHILSIEINFSFWFTFHALLNISLVLVFLHVGSMFLCTLKNLLVQYDIP
jgi:hypothetical protein